MSSSTRFPRPDHIAALTRGVRPPLAAIADLHMRTIVQLIKRAWMELVAEYPQHLDKGEEVDITVLLETRLVDRIEDDRLLSLLVRTVDRSDCTNYDGHRLEKSPDLSFHLTDRSRHFPLPVECKIIDRTKGVNLYCSDGVARFICGDYGWAGQDGIMIAYVRNGATIDPVLTNHFKTSKDDYQTEALPTSINAHGLDAARSRHGRSFPYIHSPDDLPGPIALLHLWLPIAPVVTA